MNAALGLSPRPESRGAPAVGSQQNAGLSPEDIRNSRSSTPALVAAFAKATRFGSSSPPASKSAIADLDWRKLVGPERSGGAQLKSYGWWSFRTDCHWRGMLFAKQPGGCFLTSRRNGLLFRKRCNSWSVKILFCHVSPQNL